MAVIKLTFLCWQIVCSLEPTNTIDVGIMNALELNYEELKILG